MMKYFIFFILVSYNLNSFSQSLYKTTTGKITFFSETPVENIDATNESVSSLLNTANNELLVVSTIRGFKFKKKLMERHFNENYMESDTYKTAMFKGKIIDNVDYKKDGIYNVKAKGILSIHGVDKEREIEGKVTVKGNEITISANFDVKLVDHNIEVPTIVFSKIAEVIKVKIDATLLPKPTKTN